MTLRTFSRWAKWADRKNLDALHQPGVYALRISGKALSGTPFRWSIEIAYFGMTNSVGGLRSRLRKFDNTLLGKSGHGGAARFHYRFTDYDLLVRNLYVAVVPFNCDVRRCSPRDLKVMGDVARYEYICLARFVRRYARLPRFNDRKRSPKA